MQPTAPASRPRPSSTCPPPPSTRPAPSSSKRSSPLLKPSRPAWARAAYAYLAEHATKRIVIDVPAYKHATVTVRVSGVDAAAAIAAIGVVARPQSTLDLLIALRLPRCRRRRRGLRAARAHEYATTVKRFCTQTARRSAGSRLTTHWPVSGRGRARQRTAHRPGCWCQPPASPETCWATPPR